MFDYDEEFANTSIYDELKEMAPTLEDTVPWSIFTGGTSEYVSIVTEEGLCFSFNALNSNDIYTDK